MNYIYLEYDATDFSVILHRNNGLVHETFGTREDRLLKFYSSREDMGEKVISEIERYTQIEMLVAFKTLRHGE